MLNSRTSWALVIAGSLLAGSIAAKPLPAADAPGLDRGERNGDGPERQCVCPSACARRVFRTLRADRHTAGSPVRP